MNGEEKNAHWVGVWNSDDTPLRIRRLDGRIILKMGDIRLHSPGSGHESAAGSCDRASGLSGSTQSKELLGYLSNY